jgi:hypothetical protein
MLLRILAKKNHLRALHFCVSLRERRNQKNEKTAKYRMVGISIYGTVPAIVDSSSSSCVCNKKISCVPECVKVAELFVEFHEHKKCFTKYFFHHFQYRMPL